MALESGPLIAEIEEVPATVAPMASAKAPLKKASQASKTNPLKLQRRSHTARRRKALTSYLK